MPPTDSSAPTPSGGQPVQDYTTALEQLHDLLDDAYWAATTIEAKDSINSLSQAISDILSNLEEQALDANTPQYVALKGTVDAVNTQLQSAQKQINNWVDKIDLANNVINAIAQVISSAGKVFTL